MKQISNKTLALLLIAAIVISIGGTIINVYRIKTQIIKPAEVVGLATSQGTAVVTIESLIEISATNSIDFGSSSLNGSINVTLTSETNHGQWGTWNNCSDSINDTLQGASCKGLNIENTGQRAVNVTMGVDKNSSTLFEGNNISAKFKFAVLNGTFNVTGDGCRGLTYGGSNRSAFNWTDVDSNTTYLICSMLDSSAGNDTITLEVNITIPSNESDYAATSEVRTATFTFTGTQVGT